MLTTLLEHGKWTDLSNKVVSGTGTVSTPRVDMAGFDGVLFAVKIGTIAATGVANIKAHQAATDIDGDQIAGTVITLADTDDDSFHLIDIRDPDDRFLQIQVDRTVAGSEIDWIGAVQYRANELPVTQDASVDNTKSVVRASEGV